MNRYNYVNKKGDKTYSTTEYPSIPKHEKDIYITTKSMDRLDLLAEKFYKDSSLWWIIALANKNLRKDSIFVDPSNRIRIPYDYIEVLKNIR